MKLTYFASLLISLNLCWAKLHEFHYNATWVTANPDGMHQRQVISFNGSTPLPTIEVNRGDRIHFYLTNGLQNVNTSLHFHGIFQTGSGNMDGPEMVVQCPIAPGSTFLYNFTVDQLGTYWYHSHSGMQYGDGLRGAFVVHDPEVVEANYQFDQQLVWTVSDWFHSTSWELAEKSLTRYNPTGAEPVPENILFQDTMNVTVPVEKNTTYLVHIANTGMFVSQYLYIPEHEFTVVELDGVFVKPNTTEVLYIAVGQRMSVLLTTKDTVEENYPIVQVIDDEMLDYIPENLQLVQTSSRLSYNGGDRIKSVTVDKEYLASHIYNDLYSRPIDEPEAFENSDVVVELDLMADNLGDGVNYMLLNGKTYVAPRVPTLYTLLSSGELLNNAAIYGSNTNTFVLQEGEIVDIVINNLDNGKHPFHLHGHTFQLLHKSPLYEDNPVAFNYSEFELPKHPLVRDTVMLESNGNLLIRFKADNPGVWFFHCHVDYHVALQGLAVTFVEAPLLLQQILNITESQIDNCKLASVPFSGNAAGNSVDFLNLKGENLQPKALPEGFTFKGYVLFMVSTIIGIFGLWTIKEYGMTDLDKEHEDQVMVTLKRILRDHGIESGTEDVDETTVLTG